MKRSANLLLACLLLLLTFPALAQGSVTLPLEPTVDGYMKIHATVAGHQGTFLFDSGSGFSSVSPAFAAAIGCRPWGQITGFRMTGDRLDMQHCDHLTFEMGGRSFPASTAGVFDLSKYLPSEMGPIDGTIALDLFAKETFTLSYGGHFLRVLDQAAALQQAAGRRSMPVHLVRDAEGLALTVNLPVTTSAGTAWFEMDSGNTSSLVLVNKPLAPLFQLAPEAKEAPVAVTLGDGSLFQGQARVLDLILDGNLGTSFLATHDVTVDLPHATAWVSGATAANKSH